MRTFTALASKLTAVCLAMVLCFTGMILASAGKPLGGAEMEQLTGGTVMVGKCPSSCHAIQEFPALHTCVGKPDNELCFLCTNHGETKVHVAEHMQPNCEKADRGFMEGDADPYDCGERKSGFCESQVCQKDLQDTGFDCETKSPPKEQPEW